MIFHSEGFVMNERTIWTGGVRRSGWNVWESNHTTEAIIYMYVKLLDNVTAEFPLLDFNRQVIHFIRHT
jgi:hypothetical protein